MMNPYFSFSALMSGISALVITASHLLPLYLESNALSYLDVTVLTWVLDLMSSHEGTTYSSRSGHRVIHLTGPELVSNRSLGGLGLCSLVKYLVSLPRHHVSSRSSPGQTPYNINNKTCLKNKDVRHLI